MVRDFKAALPDAIVYVYDNNSRDQTNRELSYPSVKQTADSAIHMAFTFHRRAIKYVRVTEPWVKQG